MRIGIIGAGESGVGAALLAKEKGFDVFVSDYGIIATRYKEELEKYKVDFEEGRHDFEKLKRSDLIVKSPGIPSTIPLIRQLSEHGIEVISEIEWASRFFSGKIVGITGSNGKTTTTNLAYHTCLLAGLNAKKVGNVGESFSRCLATESFDLAIVELSSFQLDDINSFRPDIAIILNITPDHLDRYNSFNQYADSKWRIGEYQTAEDVFVSTNQNMLLEMWDNCPHQSQRVLIDMDKQENGAAHLDDTWSWKNESLRGQHNAINASAVISMAIHLDIPKDIINEAIGTFTNDPHRLEVVADWNGVKIINDSKATNVDAVEKALEAFEEDIIWVVGGKDKGNDYNQIMSLVEQKVKAIVGLGANNDILKETFNHLEVPLEDTNNVSDAVERAFNHAKDGAVILLSPACASFDLFENYIDRGNQFKKAVKAYIDEH